jgi:hypothetical protein
MPNHYNYTNEELDDLVEQWHNDEMLLETLEEFIMNETGFTTKEYEVWVCTGKVPDAKA